MLPRGHRPLCGAPCSLPPKARRGVLLLALSLAAARCVQRRGLAAPVAPALAAPMPRKGPRRSGWPLLAARSPWALPRLGQSIFIRPPLHAARRTPCASAWKPSAQVVPMVCRASWGHLRCPIYACAWGRLGVARSAPRAVPRGDKRDIRLEDDQQGLHRQGSPLAAIRVARVSFFWAVHSRPEVPSARSGARKQALSARIRATSRLPSSGFDHGANLARSLRNPSSSLRCGSRAADLPGPSAIRRIAPRPRKSTPRSDSTPKQACALAAAHRPRAESISVFPSFILCGGCLALRRAGSGSISLNMSVELTASARPFSPIARTL